MPDKKPPHQQFTLDHFLPYRLVRLGTVLSNSFAQVYRERFDITIAEWRILAMLGERGRVRPTEVSRLTFMDKARVTRAIKLLLDKSLIARTKDPVDGRAWHLELTKSGSEFYTELVGAALEWERNQTSGLTAKVRSDVLKMIDRIEEILDKHADS